MKKDMKAEVIKKQSSTKSVSLRETIDAFDAFLRKYRTREAAAAALHTMKRYENTFIYKQVEEAIRNGRYNDIIWTIEYIEENGVNGPFGSAKGFSSIRNRNPNQLNINSNGNKSNSSSQGKGKAAKGTKNPAVKEAVEYGKKMHKEFDYGPGVKKEVTLPSGKRMDGYDAKNKIIYELKPDNPKAIKKGTKQLQKYVEEANKEYGSGHKGVLKTYPSKKKK